MMVFHHWMQDKWKEAGQNILFQLDLDQTSDHCCVHHVFEQSEVERPCLSLAKL